MVITIVGITGFQAYWVKQNYDREKRSLDIKTDITFKETIRQLQASKLQLDRIFPDSQHKKNIRVFIDKDGKKEVMWRENPETEMVTTINVLRDKLKDSLSKQAFKTGMAISMDKSTLKFKRDSSIHFFENRITPSGDNIIRFLYNVDSLQDSIKVVEIRAAYSEALSKQDIEIPFSITRTDSSKEDHRPIPNEVTVGFATPITYKLQIGNSFPYLVKRILSPILFSLFLVGFTIFTFALLYKNLLRQRKLAELKNDFISNITHELKTPIATVGVAIEALKNFNAIHDPRRTKEYLDISSSELQRLNLLVDKVLKLSMFEKKEIDLKSETVNLQELVNEVVSSMRLQIEKHHAKVDVKADGDLIIQGDRLHLLSVIYNLLDNAIKYSNGSPVIEFDLKEKNNFVELTVKDNGIGIPQEYKDRIFEKFFRVPAGDTHNAKGYGLGLSYVAHVVEKHNGTVSVESKAGTGTTFTINLPKQIT